MSHDDTGAIPPERLEVLRMRAVREVEAGARPERVATALGLHRTTVYGWLARYRAGGTEALRTRPPPGRPPKLSEQQVRRLHALMVDTTPRSQRVDQQLWTRQVVGTLIRREFGIALSTPSVGRLLPRLGLPPPGHDRSLPRRADLPDIKVAAQVNGATLHIAAAATGRPLGDGRPTQAIRAVTAARGAMCFALYAGTYEAPMFVDFCRRLLADSHRPTYVVVNCPALRPETVSRQFEASVGDRLRLFP